MSDQVRLRYLESFVARMEALNRDSHLMPDSFVEPEKDIVNQFIDIAYELVDGGAEGGDSGEQNREPTQRHSRKSLLQLLRSGHLNMAALLGDPGSGKSVSLRILGMGLAARARKNGNDSIPLYVPLGTYSSSVNGRPGPFTSCVNAAIDDCSSADEGVGAFLREMLQEGRLALLFDGMDEMPRGDFDQRVEAFFEYAREASEIGNPVLFACRTNDFRSTILPVTQVRLVPFKRKQIALFLYRTLKLSRFRARAWTKALLSSESPLAGIATNPLFLTLVASYVAKFEKVPQSQTEIFRSFIEPHLERAVSGNVGWTARDVQDVLEKLALTMLDDAGVGTTLPVDGALSLAGIDQTRGMEAVLLAVDAGFVRLDTRTGAFRFLHHRLQEFFAASRIMALPPEKQAAVWAHVDDGWWDEIFVLVANMGLTCDQWLTAVIDRCRTPDEPSPDDASNPKSEFIPGVSVPGDDDNGLRMTERLVLAGKFIESAAVLPSPALMDSLAGLLCDQWSENKNHAANHLASLRRIRVLRAIRGVLMGRNELRAIVDDGLRSNSSWEQEEAFVVLASSPLERKGVSASLVKEVYRTGMGRAFLSRFVSLAHVCASDPRLGFLRKHLVIAGLLHMLGVLSLFAIATAIGLMFKSNWLGGLIGFAAGGAVYSLLVYLQWRKGGGSPLLISWIKVLTGGIICAATCAGLELLSQVGGSVWWGREASEVPPPGWLLAGLSVAFAMAIYTFIGTAALVVRVGRGPEYHDKAWPKIVSGAIGWGAFGWAVTWLVTGIIAFFSINRIASLALAFPLAFALLTGVLYIIVRFRLVDRFRRSAASIGCFVLVIAAIIAFIWWIAPGLRRLGHSFHDRLFRAHEEQYVEKALSNPSEIVSLVLDLIFLGFLTWGVVYILHKLESWIRTEKEKSAEKKRQAPPAVSMPPAKPIKIPVVKPGRTVVLLTKLFNGTLPTQTRAARRLGAHEPPSEVIVALLEVAARTADNPPLIENIGRAIDMQTQNLRKRRRADANERIRVELKVIAEVLAADNNGNVHRRLDEIRPALRTWAKTGGFDAGRIKTVAQGQFDAAVFFITFNCLDRTPDDVSDDVPDDMPDDMPDDVPDDADNEEVQA